MFKHILVPIDGSLLAEAALPAAAFLAEKFQARVTLMHVVEKDAPDEVHGQSHLKRPQDAERYLKEVAQRSFPIGIRVDCHVHTNEVDDVAVSIVDHAGELGYDLVIMCSHGRGAALHLFLGSIAQRVIARGAQPVLITHPDEQGRPPAFFCRHILVPMDNNSEHAEALPISKEIARASSATLHIVTVIPNLVTLSGDKTIASKMLPGTTAQLLELEAQDAGKHFQALEEGLRQEGYEASAHVLRGDPASVVVEAAERAQIDLIVMSTHGKTGMDAFWSGSVAHRICSQSRIPLLLLPIRKA